MLVQRVCNAPAQARVRLWCYLTSIEGRVRAGSEPGDSNQEDCPSHGRNLPRPVSASQKQTAAVELIRRPHPWHSDSIPRVWRSCTRAWGAAETARHCTRTVVARAVRPGPAAA